MTYEEKVDLILQAIYEAQKYSRQGQRPKLHLTSDNGLKDVNINEIYDILCKIRDEEKVIDIKSPSAEVINKIQKGWDYNRDYFVLDIPDHFLIWYETRIIENLGRLESIDWINLLKIYDIAIDLNQQLQISGTNTVHIPSLPQMVKFPHLFPQDDIGTRRTYQDYRIQGVDFLNKRGVVKEYKYIDTMDGGYGEIKVVVDIIQFKDFFIKIGNEYQRRNEKLDKLKKTRKEDTKKEENLEKINPQITSAPINIAYDKKSGILTIQDKKVKFNKDSFRAKLLETVLKDTKSLKKEWSWDEIIEEIESVTSPDSLNEHKKKFYPACDGIAKFIAQKTGINDLLIFNKSTVQINPKYI